MIVEFTKDIEFGYDSRSYKYLSGMPVDMVDSLSEYVLKNFPESVKGKKAPEQKPTQPEA